ncbi:glutaredoxin domain-containing protein [Mycolicibacterium porcinum]|uniref:glutaredoxin domain-containing protein n=1 Tax=Mycolicibacterium porcinum TaxID=39693 RepID=UPI0008485F1C|nr:glutaredoxin domain-containing protein [Mycolicibacterium porcinum]ODR27274.1 hypothetical protein BHQ19_02720 [Mycolicibacterium porcinum]
MVTLCSKPGCPPCKATKRELDKLGLEYQQVDVTADPSAAEVVKALGYNSAPVVVVNADLHWTGFRPTQLALLGE